MKHIKKFESAAPGAPKKEDYMSVFYLKQEDIEDYCIEMLDCNFELEVQNFFTVPDAHPFGTRRLKEPTQEDCDAWYRIQFSKEETRSSTVYESDDSEDLKNFIVVFNRLKKVVKYDKIFFHFRGDFSIFIKMVKKKYERGFDVSEYMNGLHNKAEHVVYDRNRFQNLWRYQIEKSYGNSKSQFLEFSSRPTQEFTQKVVDDLKKSKNDTMEIDNKESFNDIIPPVLCLYDLREFQKDYLEVSISWTKPNAQSIDVKTGLFRKKTLIYREYQLSINIKSKDEEVGQQDEVRAN
jgi:hypothetical protein